MVGVTMVNRSRGERLLTFLRWVQGCRSAGWRDQCSSWRGWSASTVPVPLPRQKSRQPVSKLHSRTSVLSSSPPCSLSLSFSYLLFWKKGFFFKECIYHFWTRFIVIWNGTLLWIADSHTNFWLIFKMMNSTSRKNKLNVFEFTASLNEFNFNEP